MYAVVQIESVKIMRKNDGSVRGSKDEALETSAI